MSQVKYKNLIHDKLHKAAFHEFSALQAQHSKVRDIPYIDLSLQQYLKSPEFSKEDCNLLMALRYHSIPGIKANFSSVNKNDISCPLLCNDLNQDDSQTHLMSCQSVLSRLDTKYFQQVKETKYSDIHGDLVSQKAAVRHLAILLEIRRKIIEELHSTTSGPSLDTAPPARQGSSGH